MASFFELCRSSEHGIYAVPYRRGRACKAVRLPDGAIVEAPLSDQLGRVSDTISDCFGIAPGSVPATIHHANLGLIIALLPLVGVFLLSDGEIAAVYGAEAVALGMGTVSVV